MTGIFVQFSFLEYDESFLGASYYVLAAAADGSKHPGSTHNYLLTARNLHQVGNFYRKHPWVIVYKHTKTYSFSPTLLVLNN